MKPSILASSNLVSGRGRVLERGELSTAREDTMKAIVQDTYGSPDVLELRDRGMPEGKS